MSWKQIKIPITMSQSPFHDDRAVQLLSRVGDDISQLRQDIRRLFSHTARRTLPDGARDLADTARRQFAASGAYASSRLRSLKSTPPKEALGLAGGLVVVGLLAFGVYALCKNGCCREDEELEEEEL